MAASAVSSTVEACPWRSLTTRWMFSTMMIDPLATLPMPMASPPIDMTVRLTPARSISASAMRIEKGIVSDAMRPLRTSHRNSTMTTTMNTAPSRTATCT